MPKDNCWKYYGSENAQTLQENGYVQHLIYILHSLKFVQFYKPRECLRHNGITMKEKIETRNRQCCYLQCLSIGGNWITIF